MGCRYKEWNPRVTYVPQSFEAIERSLLERFSLDPNISLTYGDHGLLGVIQTLVGAIKDNKRIALYADYDVDGTMSCVSWIWFLESISYTNYVYYIPDRFKEGYGLNLKAVKWLAQDEKAQVIITMDCGITANTEALWCKENGVQFICTDHHKINPKNMPDCLILNPILHPDPDYQYLCGCGITYVLLRRLGDYFSCSTGLWYDLLALTGLATICDVVPLNSVNHKLAKLGIKALVHSKRPVLTKLLKHALDGQEGFNEQDVGFKIGPRINAVGRLDHGHKIISAFVGDACDDLIKYMDQCNEDRKIIQQEIWGEALYLAREQKDNPLIFIGGKWHTGVIGIVASKLAELFWKPVWIYSTQYAPLLKGSVRSIPSFDVTEAMVSCGSFFTKYGGHAAAAGFTFEKENKEKILESLLSYASNKKKEREHLWVSSITYDFPLELDSLNHRLLSILDSLRPFGHKFPEPIFKLDALIAKVNFYCDKSTGEKKHTCVFIQDKNNNKFKILFFNAVYEELTQGCKANFLVTVQKNYWRSKVSLSLIGVDFLLES